VLANVRSRGNDLGLADIVVLEEDDLQQITDILVVVDNASDLADEMNDGLSHPVPGRSLASKD